MPDLFEIIPIVKRATNVLREWLETDKVEGFRHLLIKEDDWGDYARLIAVMLVEGKCNCGRANCPREHDLARWDPQERTLESFIYRAVIGSAGLQANSIPQGMLFPFLRDEHGLLAVKVGFKQCTTCGEEYEGTACPYCGQAFYPATTSVMAKDWLVIKGVYVPEDVRWWACGEGRAAHYYAQQHCRERPIDNPERYPDPAYHVQHGDEQHDCCSLEGCPRYGQQHGLRGTTLWWRAVFAAGMQAGPQRQPLLMQGVLEATREAVATLQGWQYVWSVFRAQENSTATPPEERWKGILQKGLHLTDRDFLILAENLFRDRESGSLSYLAALRQLSAHAREIAEALSLPGRLLFPQTVKEVICFEQKELKPLVQEKVLRALQKRGIGEKEILAWLQEKRDLQAEWMEDNDDDDE